MVLDFEIFRRIDDEFQSHVFYCSTDFDACIEGHGALSVIFGDDGFDTFRRGDIEGRIHHIPREVYRRTAGEIEGAERNDRKFVVHLSLVYRDASGHAHLALRRHAEGKVTFAGGIDIAVAVGGEVAAEACAFIDDNFHPHVHIRLFRFFCRRSDGEGIGEVRERH